jgi:SagB-type dehydrogenase family enzyme
VGLYSERTIRKKSIPFSIEEHMAAITQEKTTIQLPKPEFKTDLPLFEALQRRASARAYSPRPLDEQTISNLLWAAYGINRPETGGRTAPSAVNWQEYDLYLTEAAGAYVYRAQTHSLELVTASDLRALTGVQDFVPAAPVNLVLVADLARLGEGSVENKMKHVYEDAGFISQNVYLFCATQGLATVVRASIDVAQLADALGLKSSQRVVLANTVGYPQA